MMLSDKVANYQTTVLILGESGVGKEEVAKHIHNNSVRRDKPFITVNCGAIPATLLESELFGYEKGAFTGAMQSGKKGIIEAANGGTLFLDEIGETPLDFQVKLLRFLESKEVRRVGSNVTQIADVRIIAATNRNLADMNQIRGEGVNCRGVVIDKDRRTGVMFKEMGAGETKVFYYRENSAASHMVPEDLQAEMFDEAEIFYFSGITPVLSNDCRRTSDHVAVVSCLRNLFGEPYIIQHGKDPAGDEDRINAIDGLDLTYHYRWPLISK